MPAPRKRPGDVTGRASADLAEQYQAEVAARAGEISILNAVALAEKDEVVDIIPVDLTPPPAPEVEEIVVDAPEEIVEIRVIENIEMMTFGAGNFYNFEAGRRYRVPAAMANHLAERGYVWGI